MSSGSGLSKSSVGETPLEIGQSIIDPLGLDESLKRAESQVLELSQWLSKAEKLMQNMSNAYTGMSLDQAVVGIGAQ